MKIILFNWFCLVFYTVRHIGRISAIFLFGKKISLFARYTSTIYQIGEMLSKRAISQCFELSDTSNILFLPCLLREIWLDSLKSQDTSCKGERRVYESDPKQAKCTWWNLLLVTLSSPHRCVQILSGIF